MGSSSLVGSLGMRLDAPGELFRHSPAGYADSPFENMRAPVPLDHKLIETS